MNLKQRIIDDLVNAMKAKDSIRTETLRSIRAEILKLEKSGLNRDINEEEENQTLLKQAKIRKEAIDIYKNAGREDLVKRESMQLDVINEYLPKQITKGDAEKIIKRIIADTGAVNIKDMGKVMRAAMGELKGKIEGRIIQEIVRNSLGG